MGDTTVPNAGQGANEGGNSTGETPTGGEFTPITSQDDLNKIIGERVARERGKFADYDVLKQAAAELQQIKDAQKTDAEKTADQIAALQAELAESKATAVRARIQASHGISDEDAELFLTATDEAALEKQAKALAALRATTSGRIPSIEQLTSASTGGSALNDDGLADALRRKLNIQ